MRRREFQGGATIAASPLGMMAAFGLVLLKAQVDPPATSELRFEVASLRMGTTQIGLRGGPGTKDPTRFNAGTLMREILRLAFGTGAVADGRIMKGEPDWVSQIWYEITANVPAGATKEQFQEMLQNLLKDRMGLQFHWTKKEIDSYRIVVAKGGLKMKPSSLGAQGAVGMKSLPLDEDKYPSFAGGLTGVQARTTNGVVRMTIAGATIEELAGRITRGIVPIVDATGLTGRYEGKVEYNEQSFLDLLGSSIPPSGDDPAPGIFAAFEKQLGLTLEKGKTQIDVVVIDHLDQQPKEN